MGKAKVRLSAFDPTQAHTAKRTGIASGGSVGSRQWDQGNGNGQPKNQAMGTNSKLVGWQTSLEFDSNDVVSLNTTQALDDAEAWMMVFAFVDLDTSSANTLAGFGPTAGSTHGYLQIASGGTGVSWQAASGKGGVAATTATNNTNNSSINYTFGTDVEVLIVYMPGSGVSSSQSYYNIDGDLIGQTGAHGKWSNDCVIQHVGGWDTTSDYLDGQLIDARFYSGSDVPPVTTASLQAIGNRYKQYKN
jgi:hypothetical protein